MLSVNGLVSGLDTDTIIESSLATQQARVDRLSVERQEIVAEQTAFSTIEGQLLGLRSSLSGILRASGNAFEGKVAESSNVEAVEVSATSSASPGVYRMRVLELAQAHQIASTGFTDTTQDVGSGTFSFRIGDQSQTSIEVEAGTSLESLAREINANTSDVNAAVVNDGTDTPYRLLLTSTASGEENAIEIDSDLEHLTFSETPVQAAKDAQLRIGSGDGAITVNSANNEFDAFLPGVRLDALQADPDEDIVISIRNDTQQGVDSVSNFVDAYNTVISFIDANSSYDEESESAGIFLGNRSAANIQTTLRDAIGGVVEGVGENLRTLSSIGISTEDDGTLTLDRSRLSEILNGEVDGITSNDVKRLFAVDGESTNSGVEFVLGTKDTRPTTNTGPYEVEINRVASAASLESVALPETISISEETEWEVEVDSTAIKFKIDAGDYSRNEFANQIQTLINTSDDRAGREIEAIIVGDKMTLRSKSIGAISSLEILKADPIGSGDGDGLVLFEEGATSKGTDVAGVFRVRLPDGTRQREEAVGNGRILSGRSDNEYTADLQVRSTLTKDEIGAETDAELTVTSGLGASLDRAIGELLDDEVDDNGNELTSVLSSIQDRYTSQIENLDSNVSQIEDRIESRRESLVRQYASLEATLAGLQSVGDTLANSLLGT